MGLRRGASRVARSQMASPSTTAPPRSKLDLVEAKLATPALRGGTVARPDLVGRLRLSSGATVVSIVAPAGYGKSTLLTQWAEADERPFAWVSLDPRDNDPVGLLSHLAGALDRLTPIGKPVLKALQAPDASVFGTIVPRLGVELSSLQAPVVLVLDDVHEVEEPVCFDALAILARHLPPASQLVVSGRRPAGLPLARYRSEGSLFELDSRDLALDIQQSGRLLRDAGLDLGEADVAELHRHAEGWAAGLYLAALAMLARDEPADPSRFTGEDRFVTDYLRAEFLGALPRRDIDFLTRTSILERMSGPFCDAVLERSGSAALLERIESSNLLLVPLDHHREWYRYHHLLRDMLQAELRRREPELVTPLHLRAAAWCSEHGQADAAVSHAIAAGDLDEVGRVVNRFALAVYRQGRSATVGGWLALIDGPDVLPRHPDTAILGAVHAALSGRTDLAIQRLEAVPPAAREIPVIRQGVASVEALLCRHGIEAMLLDAEAGAPADPARTENRHLVGVAKLLAGDDAGATEAFDSAVRLATSVGATSAAILSFAELALLALARNDVTTAEAHLRDARAWVDESGTDGYTANGLMHVAAARIAIRRGDIAAAQDDMVAAHRLRPMLTDALPWYSVQARLELARAHLALADRAAAMTLLAEAREVLRTRPDLGVLGSQVEELTVRVREIDDPVAVAWASSLTVAELRLLPLLTTHLTFREIAERLYVSRNTVKTQAISVYRKLGVSSRSEAIERATELGLIGG